jgi:hypothetical protein
MACTCLTKIRRNLFGPNQFHSRFKSKEIPNIAKLINRPAASFSGSVLNFPSQKKMKATQEKLSAVDKSQIEYACFHHFLPMAALFLVR